MNNTGAPTSVRQLDYDGQEFAFEDPAKVGPSRFDLYAKAASGTWELLLSDRGESAPEHWAKVLAGEKIRIVRVDETLVYDSDLEGSAQ